MSGYIDLHCHYLPGIDDGVRDLDEGVALLRRLAEIGYAQVVATPHIRTAMFDNRRPALEAAFSAFATATADLDGLPRLGLGAEHFFDDVVWSLFLEGHALPYPGGHAALIEFSADSLPLRVADRFFEMNVRGVRPVIAHPERYAIAWKRTDSLDPLLDIGALALLDLMSLHGRYGRKPRNAARRMLDEGAYYAACTDSHRPADADAVAAAIDDLFRLVGEEEALELLRDNPRRILSGEID